MSWKRVVRHRMGVKAPKGMGIFTNPKKAVYNKVYNKTSISADRLIGVKRKSNHSSRNNGSCTGFILLIILRVIFLPFTILIFVLKLLIKSENPSVITSAPSTDDNKSIDQK